MLACGRAFAHAGYRSMTGVGFILWYQGINRMDKFMTNSKGDVTACTGGILCEFEIVRSS